MAQQLKPITLERLYSHFRNTYQLDQVEAEQMVASATKSVVEALRKCQEAIQDGDLDLLAGSAHNLKGVLLNMGQEDWAEQARALETAVQDETGHSYQLMLERLGEGAQELVAYQNSKGEKR